MQAETKTNGNSKTDGTVPGHQYSDAYPFPLDAIVLAGTHQNPKRLINGRNKAFLKVGGQALIRYVVTALMNADSIGQIYVVGPADELIEELVGFPPMVKVIAQRGAMLANCWAGIEASEDCRRYDPVVPVRERPMLIISCDLPLVTARSVDDFVCRCARVDKTSAKPNAILAGCVDEPGVKSFHPSVDQLGIKRPFVELECGRLRLANIYVGRPRNLSHQEFLQTGFSYRKAKDWRNVVALTFTFFRSQGGWHAARMSMRLQLTLMLSKRKGGLYRRLRKGNTQERVEKSISDTLGGPVKIVITPFGGLSLDVDDEEDFRILNARYGDWAAITAAVKPESN